MMGRRGKNTSHRRVRAAKSHAQYGNFEGTKGEVMSAEKEGGQKTADTQIAPATGKLGVMVVGLGAVATTLIDGVEAVRRGLAKPIGSLTQMGTVRLGKRTDG